MKRLLILFCLHLPFIVDAHSGSDTTLHKYGDNRNAWFMYFGDHKFSDRFGVHIEAQLRRWDLVQHPQQLLLRTGLNYHLNPDVFFTAGYCYVYTSRYGVFPVAAAFPEHRIWQQVQVKSRFGKVEWTGRLRTEQRFSKLPVMDTESNTFEPGDAVYTNRYRLLNRLSIPLKGRDIADHSFYLTVYDEIMINSGHSIAANFLDQNRAYFALGYKFHKIGRLEAGYLEQTIFKSDGVKVERNHTLQLSFISTLDFRKKNP